MSLFDQVARVFASEFATGPTVNPEYQSKSRQWICITDDEIDLGLCKSPYALKSAQAWRDGVEWAQEKLKKKNL